MVLLSLIMPVFHAENYIRERIKQLLTHDLSNIQLVVVICEDGYDNSVALCKELLHGIPNTEIIIQSEQGLSIARNIGLDAAKGEYVYFIDSDDVLLEPGFSELIKQLKNTQSDVTVCKFALLQENGRDFYPVYDFPGAADVMDAKIAIYNFPDSIWNVWRYVCRTKFLRDNNLSFVPGLICEDVEWTPRMLDAADSILFFDTPVYGYYYNNPTQLTKKITPKRTLDINKTVAEGINKYKNKPYAEPLCCRFIRESLYSISDYCKFSRSDRKEIRPFIEACEIHYRNSSNIKAKIYIITRIVVPLYVWSAALNAMKAIRGKFKAKLGATGR